ncbi:Ureidoglycolate dehydrogenase (NAD(+)) [Pigmentiphaga humi]|uniref:Ureidoglycolate dehydrogenase (NAD(+)) n=1 Tax=Pigmentiphaga humi TaxID=2478468 RepID=A0A3P4B2B0_9BURK|nr:Ldh family oxidoreductase [Pigmentiphaga humi]VCU70419.1 Ureidoglycolate dehydrogenase (NAD(+)) [Pigmentiphaga humi]
METPKKVKVGAQALHAMVRDMFAAAGMEAAPAGVVADVLVWANLRGVDSHGIARVPRYLEMFASGEAAARAAMETQRLRPGVLMVHAKGAPGPVALTHAVRQAMEIARETGVCWAAVRGTVHTGAIGYYTELAAREGFAVIGLVAGVPNMAYTGSSVPAVATSPVSIAMPSAAQPTPVLDMATAAIALGKIAQYKIAGKPLPEGSALDADGVPTTDAAKAETPLPMAGAKGAGLSLMLELLCGVLTGNPIVTEYHTHTPEGERHRQNATFIVADVSAFQPPDRVRAMVDATLDTLHGLPRSGADAILFPGERGASTLAARSASGIPLPMASWKKLVADAERLGVRPAALLD